MVLFFKLQQCVNLGVFCSGEHHLSADHALLVVSRLQHCTWYVSLSQNHGDHPLNHLPSICTYQVHSFPSCFTQTSQQCRSLHTIFLELCPETHENYERLRYPLELNYTLHFSKDFHGCRFSTKIMHFTSESFMLVGESSGHAKLQICFTFAYQDLT